MAQLNEVKYGLTQRPAPTADDHGRSDGRDLRNGQIEQGSPALPGENNYNSDEVKYGKPEPRNQPGSANTPRDFQRRGDLRAELPAETATQSEPVAEYRAGSGNPDYPTDGKVNNEAEKVGNDRTGSGRSGHSDTSQPGESGDDSRLAQGGDDVAGESGKIGSNAQMPQTNATNKASKYQNIQEQMPKEISLANATNATIVNPLDNEFATPSGWGKLWRLERNGNYCTWRLRFTDSAEIPKEFRRITRPGGKITPTLKTKLAKRKGRGRHAESRSDAERFRGRALDLAKRIRSGIGSGTESKTLPNATNINPDFGAMGNAQMPQMRSLDDSGEMSGVWKSNHVM